MNKQVLVLPLSEGYDLFALVIKDLDILVAVSLELVHQLRVFHNFAAKLFIRLTVFLFLGFPKQLLDVRGDRQVRLEEFEVQV